MATVTKQQIAAKEFIRDWTGKGYEKGETQRFWLDLLHRVFGVENPTQIMAFELPVKTFTKEKGSDFIDGYITTTKVLIEQKGSHVDLSLKLRQSDGLELTPYQQARRYATGLPHNMNPRWIIACNFSTFEVHDMEHPNDAPEIIKLADLEKEYHRLSFLVDETNVHLKKELEVSIQAGEIVGVLYDKFREQYHDPNNPDSQKALNKLCVRLVFCLYAEDAGIFGSKNMFHDYLAQFSASEFREKLIKLFRILDQKPEDRDPYEDDKLLAFPYVSGGLFYDDIEIPRITEEIRTLLLQRASDDFDWSLISPTIFGAVFESTLNPSTRRSGGMHYTSLENIHKVIDPLFLDDLKAELSDIKAEKVVKTKKDRAKQFQDKLASLKFLDPACGSGNFLTESYTCLRRLENEALKIIYGGDRMMGGIIDPIKVSIYQFYGIEINDFACSVSQAALWIAETQMLKETDAIVGYDLEPLPLKDYHNIHEGNALRMDWNEVVPASELNYIMGNPPFVGKKYQTKFQKEDMNLVFNKMKGVGNLDYVTAWYKKAATYLSSNRVLVAFVSTNSIVQGEHIPLFWKPFVEETGACIHFAHRTFKWENESKGVDSAAVHCVIIGWGLFATSKGVIYDGSTVIQAKNVHPYLMDMPNVFVENRSRPIQDVSPLVYGSFALDDGNYTISDKEYQEILTKEPGISKYLKLFIGSEEFIKGKKRYCVWLKNADIADIRKSPILLDKISKVKQWRESSNRKETAAMADYPMLFAEDRQPDNDFLAIPITSSERRRYVPMGYMSKDIIASNHLLVLPNATLYEFGCLISSVHMAWMRVVCGRLETRYNYSARIVYNNFPWPEIAAPHSQEVKEKIEQTAQAILDARSLYPDSTLADLYDELTMPPELRKAHRANDAAVLEAYGFPKDASEAEIVARLFKMYQELTNNQ